MNSDKRCIVVLFVAVLCFPAMLCLAQSDAVEISPVQPEHGDLVTITYNPDAKNTGIKETASGLTLVFGYKSFYALPNKIEMDQKGKGWETSFHVPEYAKYASFYFKSGTKSHKKPSGRYFDLIVYSEGKPARNAFLQKSRGLGDQLSSDANIDSMRARLYKKELEYHPDNFSARINLLEYKMKQQPDQKESLLDQVRYLIETQLSQQPPSPENLGNARQGYAVIGEEAKYDSLKKAIIEKYPGSQIALEQQYKDAGTEKNPDKKAELYRRVAHNSGNSMLVTRSYEQLFKLAADTGDADNMITYAEKWVNGREPWKARTHNEIAHAFADKNLRLDIAEKHIRKALQLVDKEPVGAMYYFNEYGYIPGYSTDSTKQKKHKDLKGEILATLGFIQIKKEKYELAEVTLSSASELTDDIKVQKYLAGLYQKTGRPKKAYDRFWDILMKKPADKEAREALKKSYIAFNGSEDGFNEETAELDKAWRQKMEKKFNKERLDKAAPSLAGVTDLEGNLLDTESLDNKVVVIDFWATWCGPCLAAFPYLENVYEKYQDNPEVKFVVLNSAWSNTIKDARKWKNENDYTFPLYFDKDSRITEAFGVRGIPTTFVIGKNGRIQFKKVGFGGGDMEPKLALKIDMLLNDQNKESIISRKNE